MKLISPILGLLIINNLVAQSIITDRPDQTESSSTILKSSLQIETGLLLEFTENKLIRHSKILSPTTLFRYGITNNVELRLFHQLEHTKNSSQDNNIIGISDIEIGTKIQILKKKGINTKISFLTHIILPTGSTGLSLDRYGSINKLSFSHEINDRISIGYNLGYDYLGDLDQYFTYSLAFGLSINEKVGIYIESYGQLNEIDDHSSNFDTGFTFLITRNFQFDFSFGTGATSTMNYISSGISWNILSCK